MCGLAERDFLETRVDLSVRPMDGHTPESLEYYKLAAQVS